MINAFAILLTHLLIAIAAIRLLSRADLDKEAADSRGERARPWLKDRSGDA